MPLSEAESVFEIMPEYRFKTFLSEFDVRKLHVGKRKAFEVHERERLHF